MNSHNDCRYLEWDSDFFKRRIARVTAKSLNQDNIDPILEWCERQFINCLYFLADSGDATSIRTAEDHLFRLVDARITLAAQMDAMIFQDSNSSALIRPSQLADIPALRAIARISHRDTRFYFDPCFSQRLCDALYETWIENSCRGDANVVLVSQLPEGVAGYASCHLKDNREGQFGLVGIHSDWTGRGIGRALVLQALKWFADQGVYRVSVVTQGRNVKAQRLYQRCGFLTQSVDLWYHRWFGESGVKKP